MCFIITILLTFYVVVHLDNTFCVENLLITANMGPKVPIKFRLMFTLSLSLFMVCQEGRGFKTKDDSVTWEGGGQNYQFF